MEGDCNHLFLKYNRQIGIQSFYLNSGLLLLHRFSLCNQFMVEKAKSVKVNKLNSGLKIYCYDLLTFVFIFINPNKTFHPHCLIGYKRSM